MKKLFQILTILILSKVSYSQETLWMDDSKYLDLTERVTLVYHNNGTVGKRYIKKKSSVSKINEWDEFGNLIRKSKSGRKLISKEYYHQVLVIKYYENGKVKQKTFSKMQGCYHSKRRWRKFYSESGKLGAKEK